MDDYPIRHESYKCKHRKRKARHTFPNELDTLYDKPSRHKHRRRTHTHSIANYNSGNIVHITEYDDLIRKRVVRKCKANKERMDEQHRINTTPMMGCLSAIAVKILCILGLISFAT